jgi:glycosyltransferase involved in cell wall biosynthesis
VQLSEDVRGVPGGRPTGSASTVVAVAPGDPLAPSTFSGYARHLFTGMRDRGVAVTPLASRDLRWHDLPAALNWAGLARGRLRGRYAPRIRPDWYWSRAGFERFSARLDARLARMPAASRQVLLQVGTHVRPSVPGTAVYCVTDCTVVQAVEAGEFAISQASPRVVEEAVACQREVFAGCAKVLTLSGWAAGSVVRDYGIPPERVVAVGAGANLPAGADLPAGAPSASGAARRSILFVGMDWEQKGGPLLVEAFRLVRERRPGASLTVVGCRPELREPGVEVVGYLPPGDPGARRRLLGLYAEAGCLALLSAFDCYPNVLLEAQAMGVPVVTYAGQGRPEQVRHGETGLLVERLDAPAVAAALVAALDRAEALGAKARRFAEQRFTWPAVIGRVLGELGVA